MTFFPKPRFKWREPKEFLQRQDQEERVQMRWWFQPLMVVVSMAVLLLNWYLARFNPAKHPPPFHVAVLLGVTGSVFFAYGVPWIVALCPSEVRLYEKYVTRSRGNSNRRLKYADIEYFAWRTPEETTILVLKPRKDRREMLLGVPTAISKYDVRLFLLSKEVMVQPGTR